MRTYVDMPGGKMKRVSNRRDGNYDRRNERQDGFFESGRQSHDSRRDRRASRQLLRRVTSGEGVDSDE